MKQNQEKVWDALAEQWYHFRHQPFKDVSKEIKKLSKLKKGKILEIGCGNCRNLLPFAKSGFDCYGIDFSKEMIKFARKYCKKHELKVKLKKARAEKLPFKNREFDYILNIATLHHLNKKEQEKSVKEMWRVLKPKGLALIAVWNIKNENRKVKGKGKNAEKEKIKEKYIGWKVKGKTYWRYYYLFTMPELKKLFKEHGFKIIKDKKNNNLIILVKKC